MATPYWQDPYREWIAVPCSIEGCNFAFLYDRYLKDIENGEMVPRGDVFLFFMQGRPQPIYAGGLSLCIVPGCLRDITDATHRPFPHKIPSEEPLNPENPRQYTISQCGPDREACSKIQQAYDHQEDKYNRRGFPCVMSGCDRLLRLYIKADEASYYFGPDESTMYFAYPLADEEDKTHRRCLAKGCGKEAKYPPWLTQWRMDTHDKMRFYGAEMQQYELEELRKAQKKKKKKKKKENKKKRADRQMSDASEDVVMDVDTSEHEEGG